mgnify:CR=1 FL=1
MKIREEFKVREMAGEHVIVMPGRGGAADMTRIVSLNPSSMYLWEKLRGREFTAADAALLLTEECTRTVYAVQLLPPFVWEDPLPPLPDAPAALSLTLTMRDVEEIDACPAALGHRLACGKAGKRWLHHPRAETYLSERVALFQRLYR